MVIFLMILSKINIPFYKYLKNNGKVIIKLNCKYHKIKINLCDHFGNIINKNLFIFSPF